MADLCKQCAREIEGSEHNDFEGCFKKPKKGYGYLVLCEGCGPILINEKGERISKEILLRKNKKG